MMGVNGISARTGSGCHPRCWLVVLATGLLVNLVGLPGPIPAQGLPPKLAWILKKADVIVRKSEPPRYVVEAFLDYHPPKEAHPQIDPGALTIWFFGDARKQDLKLEKTEINGKEVLRGTAPDERGTQVLLHIEYENRMAPLAVHLQVGLNEVKGRVALPVSLPHPGVEVVVTRPDGSTWKPDEMPTNLVVDEKRASRLGMLLLQVGVGACGLAVIVIVVLVLRRRDPNARRE